MCLNSRWIVSPHDGRYYYCNCGHCEPCLQEKANRRVSRIRFESREHACFFVTLDYLNQFIPYVRESEYLSFFNNRYSEKLNVYRGNKVIDVLTLDDFCRGSRCTLDSIDFPRLNYIRQKVNGRMVELTDMVSVLRVRDFQLFFKRLKIALSRAGYTGYFSYFYTGDYGGQFTRQHVHALIYFSKGFDEVVRRLIIKSWPYSDLSKPRGSSSRQPIELAKNPARYVSSYINSVASIPSVLSVAKPFKMFYHFSNHFGCVLSEFSLPSILQKIRNGYLYFDRETIKDGCLTVSPSRVPSYVLSRYFPKFKGYSYLSSDEIINLVERPESIFFNKKYNWSFDDRQEISRKLVNLKLRIPKNCYYEWLNLYPFAWSCYASASLRSSYDDVCLPSDMFYHFYNIDDFYRGDVGCDFLDDLLNSGIVFKFIVDPLDFPSTVVNNQRLLRDFANNIKHHSVKNEFYG